MLKTIDRPTIENEQAHVSEALLHSDVVRFLRDSDRYFKLCMSALPLLRGETVVDSAN